MNATIQVCRCVYDNKGCLGIMSYLARINANKEGNTAPLIDNLEIIKVFKDEDEEEEASVIDFIR